MLKNQNQSANELNRGVDAGGLNLVDDMPILRIWPKVTSRDENARNTACFCDKVVGRREVCTVLDWFHYKPKVLNLKPTPQT